MIDNSNNETWGGGVKKDIGNKSSFPGFIIIFIYHYCETEFYF